MKMTFQMELNVSGEKNLRRWRKLEQRQQVATQRELIGWFETGSRLAAELFDQLTVRKRQAVQGVAVPFEPSPFPPADPLRTCGASIRPEADPLTVPAQRDGDFDALFADAGREPCRRRSSLAEVLKRKPVFADDPEELRAEATLSAQVKEAGEAMKRFGERFRRLEKAAKAAGLLDRHEAKPVGPSPAEGLSGSGIDVVLGEEAA